MMKKFLLIFMLIFLVTATSIPVYAQTGFSDIAGHWGKDSITGTAKHIRFLAEDGKFMPDKALTRREFVLMLQKSLGIQIMYFKETDVAEFFSDVTNEDEFASALYDMECRRI